MARSQKAPDVVDAEHLSKLAKALGRARTRARYRRSGNPGHVGFKPRPCHDGSLQYELAMSDQEGLVDQVNRAGGKAESVDYRQKFRAGGVHRYQLGRQA